MVIAFIATRGWYEYLGVAITALLHHNPDVKKIYIFIEDDVFPYFLDDERVIPMNIYKLPMFVRPDSPNYNTRYTLLGFVPFCLSKYIGDDKCLFIDTDVIVTGDISPLWNTDMGDCVIAGVREPFKSKGFVYINAGVCLFDLKKMRDERIDDLCIDLCNTTYLEYVNQDILNTVCRGRIAEVDSRYNKCPFVAYTDNPVCLHGTWNDKGWIETSPYHGIWLDYKKLLYGN